MKTKLSFLALPSLCLGIVLTIVLAACTSGGSSSDDDKSSNSNSGGGGTSSAAPDVKGQLEITDLGVEVRKNGEKADLTGMIAGKAGARIFKIVFSLDKSASSWLYDGENDKSVNTTMNFDDPGVPSHALSKYYIDLTAISGCGSNVTFTVEAYSDKDGKDVTRKSAAFKKDCVNSSSSQTTAQSSSSEEKKWQFEEPPTTVTIADSAEWVTIKNSSVTFAFRGDEPGQPDLEVKGGYVRKANGCPDDEDDNLAGKEDCLGSDVATKTKVSESNPDDPSVGTGNWVLIYSGNDRWLLHFLHGDGIKWAKWPKKCTYWKAKVSPK